MTVQKKTLFTSALAVALLIGATGGTALTALQANAASNTTTTTNVTSTPSSDQNQQQPMQGGQFDPTQGGHVGANGKKEELLTGDTATKAKASAQAKVPGATVDRAETDAEGATYEVHMTKSDGSRVTVKLDGNFNATSVETGEGQGPQAPPTQK